MGLSQVLQLLQNKAHPSARGGVPITPTVKTFNREATGIDDYVGEVLSSVDMEDSQPMLPTQPQRPGMPMVVRNAPTLNNSGSQDLMRQAQAILAGLGNDPRPQIQSPNNEAIALALLPALLGAGTSYIGKLGQGYMAGQNQELAQIEQERRRREQNILRQAQGLQSQAREIGNQESALFNQANQNYRGELADDRMRELATLGADTRMNIADAGNQTRMDIAEGQQAIQQAKLDLDREKTEIGNAAKLWVIALKEANMDGSVTAADVARLESLRKEIGGDKYASRLALPPVGSSWQKIKTDADNVYKQLVLTETTRRNQANEAVAGRRVDVADKNANANLTRANKPTASRGGGVGDVGGGRSASSLKGSIQTLQGKIDGEKKAQAIMGDPKSAALAEIRIQRLAGERDNLQKELDKLGKLSRPLGEIPEVAVTDRSKFDKVNPMLLQDALSFGGFKPTISTANTGHSEMTKAGYPSRHKQNNAVDISAINGIPVGTPAGRKLADEYVRNLEARGYIRNRESGNDRAVLWQTDGHYNHIHISRNSKGDGGGIRIENSYADGGDKTQIQGGPPAGTPKVKDGKTKSGKEFKFK